MNRLGLGLVVLLMLTAACNEQKVRLQEIRSNWKGGPEFRDRGETHLQRWTAQTGLEGQWSNGWETGVEYRNRSNSGADGYDEDDHGMWFTFSFPLWKAEERDSTAALEKRIERLEKQLEKMAQQ